MKKRPNIIGRWIIDTFIPDYIGSSGIGDYEELYQKIAEKKASFFLAEPASIAVDPEGHWHIVYRERIE